MPSSISLLLLTTAVSVVILLFSTVSSAAPVPNVHRPFKKIYAFGDSFTDTGNSRSGEGPAGFGHLSSPPYGMTYFGRPTNRYTDGRLAIDFVAQSMNLPFLPPYLGLRSTKGSNGTVRDTHGVNFAVSGATVIKHAFFVKNNLTLDMTPQSIETELGWFDKYLETLGTDQKVSLFKDSLFWIGEIGVNDYAYTLGSTVSSDTIRQLSISTFTRFLETLLNKGVKYMLVQGHPATGCLTLAMSLAAEDDRDSLGCVKSANNQSYIHNLALQSKLKQLRIKYPTATIVYADYWNAYRAVIQNPGKYGITEKFKACCGTGEPYNFQVFQTCGTAAATACKDPSQYINWDGVHLTEAMYKVMADMFLGGTFTRPRFSNLLIKKLNSL
ncbi:PREDICTED: GDSL esterase/lipase At3g48460-like [Camelina sativa]|uniref:GDSL esterase/lipase At3g48460-like n=1 Tax=Camelina sativa TaxID=90675 RepID=A0ABM0YN39_CAMSA|nr:PREDICTED: GDSL esterase/lipase At3g48460-like [Camelina sativa]